MQWIDAFELPGVSGWIEILILATMLYFIFRLIKGTRGSAILSGLILLFGILFAITSLSHLDVLNWLLSKLMLLEILRKLRLVSKIHSPEAEKSPQKCVQDAIGIDIAKLSWNL